MMTRAPRRLLRLPLALALLAACARPEPKAIRLPDPNRSGPLAPTPRAEGDPQLSKLLGRIRAAYEGGRYEEGLSLVKEVLSLKRTDLGAYDRIGSTYFILGRYGEALTVWERGLYLEHNPARRAELQESIAFARHTLGLGPAPRPPEPAPRTALPPPPRRRVDPEEVAALYEQGVVHYTAGEYLQAASVFIRVLELDPNHAKARAGLERLKLLPK